MIDEANLLCERLEKLVADALAITSSEARKDNLKQLQAVQRAISTLEKAGATVPGELIREKNELVEIEREAEAACSTLRTLHMRLKTIIAAINPPHSNSRRHRASQRLKPGEYTPQAAFRQPIIEVLRELGGSGDTQTIKTLLQKKWGIFSSPRISEHEQMEEHRSGGTMSAGPGIDSVRKASFAQTLPGEFGN